jgi:membrane protease YdiL (CAAX protease family)
LFCFAAGFGEELLFRGIVQQQLELLVGISPAAIAVAVGFGCVFFFLVRFSG